LSGNKTAIVFGGSGFVGEYLIRELKNTGEFSRIVSADIKAPSSRLEGVDYITCDIRAPIEMAGNLENAEIYNLAAVHITPGHQEWEYFWTNVIGAMEVCKFAQQIDARSIFFTSSISVYQPSDDAHGENWPLLPETAYGRSKLIAERVHRDWRTAQAGRKLFIVRPAVIFGPGENANFTRLARALKTRRFAFPGHNRTVKACIYVGELVRSMLFVRKLGNDEVIYNGAYPSSYTSGDICQAFCDVAGYHMPRLAVPLGPMLLAGWVFEKLSAFGIRTSINRARVLKLVRSTNIKPGQLVATGYQFETDLQAGLRRWLQESPTHDFT